jgi:hypothetical protein
MLSLTGTRIQICRWRFRHRKLVNENGDKELQVDILVIINFLCCNTNRSSKFRALSETDK